jgi:hypothetical protein
MDLEVLANLSWRGALVALVAILVAYVLVAFWRMNRLKRANEVKADTDTMVAHKAVAAYSAVQDPEPAEAVAELPEPEPLAAPSEAAFPWNEPPVEIPGQRRIEALEREVTSLRKEVGSLRAEVLVLREEQRRENTQVQVAQNVSPLYSDAMQLAIQGHDAVTIAQHCGISRGEAELVVSLARNQDLQ